MIIMNKKGFYILLLVSISIIFFSFSINSILINKFNNSLSSENLTFFGNENITRYLEIPRYSNVTSAFMNLSGYSYENWIDSTHVANPSFETGTDWTYSETDVDFVGEFSTAWSTQGSSSYKLYVPAPSYWIDGYSYNKIIQVIDFDNITKMRFDWKLLGAINRFHFQMLVGETVKWETTWVLSGTTIVDVSDETGNQVLGFKLLHNYPSKESYSPEVYFFIDDIEEAIYLYPQNLYLKIGAPNGNYDWNYAGEFSSIEKTPDLSSEINSALNSGACDCVGCSLKEDNCSIPFLFHSDTAGKIEYSDVNINYNFTYPPTLENYWYEPLYPSSLSLGTIFANFSDSDGVHIVQVKYWYHYVAGSKKGENEKGGLVVMNYLGDNIWKHNLTITPTPDNDGYFKVRFRANDTLGIEKNYPSSSGWQLYMSFDDTTPETTININEGDYITSSTEIILITTDSDLDGSGNYIPSGVNFTAYKINEGELKNYSGLFNIPGEDGTYTIKYYSVDNAENEEDVKTLNVILDNTAPITTSNFTSNEGQTSNILIELSCEDPLVNSIASGCSQTYYCIETHDTCEPLILYSETINHTIGGIHYLRFKSQDVAGNWEKIKSQIIKLDKLGPSIKITSPKDNYNLTGDVEIFVNISDELSGVESVSYKLKNLTDVFKEGNLNYDNVTGKYRGLLKDVLRDIPVGIYTLEVTAKDNFGNEATDNITIKAIEFILVDITPITSNVPFGENSTVEFDINFTIRGGDAIRMKISDLSSSEGAIYTPEQLNARLVYNGTEYPVRNNYLGDKIILPSTPAGAKGNVKFKMDVKSYMVPGNYHANYQFEITWA